MNELSKIPEKISLKDYWVHLEAGASKKEEYLHVSGDFVRCIYSDQEFKLNFDNETPTVFDQGMAMRPQYNFVTVINPYDDRDLNVRLILGFGWVDDTRAFVRNSAIPQKSPELMQIGEIGVDQTAEGTLLAPLNPNRREIIMENKSETDTVRVSPDPDFLPNGLQLEPGAERVLHYAGKLWGYNETSANPALVVVSLTAYAFDGVFF